MGVFSGSRERRMAVIAACAVSLLALDKFWLSSWANRRTLLDEAIAIKGARLAKERALLIHKENIRGLYDEHFRSAGVADPTTSLFKEIENRSRRSGARVMSLQPAGDAGGRKEDDRLLLVVRAPWRTLVKLIAALESSAFALSIDRATFQLMEDRNQELSARFVISVTKSQPKSEERPSLLPVALAD